MIHKLNKFIQLLEPKAYESFLFFSSPILLTPSPAAGPGFLFPCKFLFQPHLSASTATILIKLSLLIQLSPRLVQYNPPTGLPVYNLVPCVPQTNLNQIKMLPCSKPSGDFLLACVIQS